MPLFPGLGNLINSWNPATTSVTCHWERCLMTKPPSATLMFSTLSWVPIYICDKRCLSLRGNCDNKTVFYEFSLTTAIYGTVLLSNTTYRIFIWFFQFYIIIYKSAFLTLLLLVDVAQISFDFIWSFFIRFSDRGNANILIINSQNFE